MKYAVSLLFLAFSFSAHAETTDCSASYVDSNRLNAIQLISSAKKCMSKTTAPEAVAMLLFAQIRSGVDIVHYSPATDKDDEIAGKLLSEIYYRLGGLGPVFLYRDEAQFKVFRKNLANWDPLAGSKYSPGWDSKEKPNSDEYLKNLAELYLARLSAVDSYRLQMNDSEYSKLYEERQLILGRNPEGLQVGSDDGNRVKTLGSMMKKRADQLAKAAD